jgi:hypothetical protein
MSELWAKVQESWKAILAFVGPLVVATGSDLVDAGAAKVEAIGIEAEWWIASAFTSVIVWLKANKPS